MSVPVLAISGPDGRLRGDPRAAPADEASPGSSLGAACCQVVEQAAPPAGQVP